MNIDHNYKKIYIYFWSFGLINNVLYVVILVAAIDIVKIRLPKSIVLLADILPSFIIKIASPFFIDRIKYSNRIWCLILLSCIGMYLVSQKSVLVSLLGICLTSLSSGFGETTFLQLTHYYRHTSLNGWSSGTGAAGLVGSSVYMLLTSILKFSPRQTLLLFSIMPFAFLLYFKLDDRNYTLADSTNDNINIESTNEILLLDEEENERCDTGHPSLLLDPPDLQFRLDCLKLEFLRTVEKLKPLFVPYMLPLSIVYLFEYLINQAVSPTLLFPINETENLHFYHSYRDLYVLYGTLYQCGVFISRSTASYFRFKKLFLLSYLQGFNFLLAIIQSWYFIIKTPWILMILILYEGLIGGSSYVNTFMNILEDVEPQKIEFSLGATSIADSSGIFFAALIGLMLEPELCRHQVNDGRPWCQLE
ncbi:hypothetical protein TPHA_0I02680 [Tetrapisispora phaffii CBS 4417]|uniref:Protein BTN n=1 Tax=Tetrapisispora phaffii (strain ATCC 24235 / CBS 4417 / NBRC 1672 / NRRL Y-8282 / UCD 70-5) TaxID=1071381 RepID=G8BXZ1_TETPH|nr:hypothetical protein TPHA_0I02680 [Tetrapisispora phaffii CBS 4417]CCE64769.1 hypothetical protein TPHA_0I02680 [Tetrapisispora phaffii CBS 4417]